MEYGWKAVRYSRVGPKAENGGTVGLQATAGR